MAFWPLSLRPNLLFAYMTSSCVRNIRLDASRATATPIFVPVRMGTTWNEKVSGEGLSLGQGPIARCRRSGVWRVDFVVRAVDRNLQFRFGACRDVIDCERELFVIDLSRGIQDAECVKGL